MEAIKSENICKRFGTKVALNNVTFSVEKGCIFGIIGPDGAGKSTLLRTLSTLTTPDKGTAIVNGYDIKTEYKELRKHIGYMPEIFSLYQDLTVEENLEFYASIFNVSIQENYSVIEPVFCKLEPFRKRMAGKLSGGMKQKLALSCALIHQPDILFLDEPTRGVDPVSQKEFRDILTTIKARGITIVLSTSYMDEASMCDCIGFFNDGHFLQTGSPNEIISSFSKPIYSVRCLSKYKVLMASRQWEDTESCYINGDTIHIIFTQSIPDTYSFEKYILDTTNETIKISKTEPTIEDCFMTISNIQPQ